MILLIDYKIKMKKNLFNIFILIIGIGILNAYESLDYEFLKSTKKIQKQ